MFAELILDGPVEALADPVRPAIDLLDRLPYGLTLGAVRLGSRVVHVLDGQVELIGMASGFAAMFGAAVRQDAQQADAVSGKEGVTLSFSRPAAVIAVFPVQSLQAATRA